MSEGEIVVKINNFITHIKISNSRRPKYYTKSKIPKRFQNNPTFDDKGYLLDEEGKRVIKNTRSVGTPDLWAINGQALYSSMHPFKRNTIVRKLKKYFEEHLKNVPKIHTYPISIELDVYRYPGYYDPRTNKWMQSFDLDNFCWILLKTIQDVLTDSEKLIDDNVNYVNSIKYRFYPIKKNSPRKLVVRIKNSEENRDVE